MHVHPVTTAWILMDWKLAKAVVCQVRNSKKKVAQQERVGIDNEFHYFMTYKCKLKCNYFEIFGNMFKIISKVCWICALWSAVIPSINCYQDYNLYNISYFHKKMPKGILGKYKAT